MLADRSVAATVNMASQALRESSFTYFLSPPMTPRPIVLDLAFPLPASIPGLYKPLPCTSLHLGPLTSKSALTSKSSSSSLGL